MAGLGSLPCVARSVLLPIPMKSLLLLPVLLAVALPVADRGTAVPCGDHDWAVDSGHSSVMFRVEHANVSWFYGSFDVIEGTVNLDPKAPEAGKVELTIPVDSVHTRDAKRDDHLKGPDFFHGKENPRITFTSTRIGLAGDAFSVTGDLELAGVKKPVTLTVEKTGEGEFMGKRLGYATTFTIKRSDFGMNYGLAKNALGDEVTLWIALELIQPKK